MTDLEVTVDDRTLNAEWIDDNPDLRGSLAVALPVVRQAIRWGDELYFDASLDGQPETTNEEVPVGTIAYWEGGEVMTLFWGPTPASTDDTPKAAAPVAPLARVEDVDPLVDLDGGATVRIESVA
ncbi:cyclophilin-like family protein [Halorhabdus amylolytica]|uniref:cyclophilin-like family protein n=1 Tax=Halorhabdus amylolytica TaxID=2559573 RepID=UPI0010AB1828|nr:cyclophilin-like family protein [Halorhabdus amylolytica]